ncbi:hypothetical protein DFH29DRAFT_554692 [Suillus ampliporus]|nr:hypothetical protein DFH29DRAFT_554692 [Suillus ampliporus]
MKKRLSRLVGRSRSNPHLPVEGGASEIESSSRPSSRNASRRGLSGLFPKFVDKLTNHSAQSARQSPNPEPAAASSSAQDVLHPQTSKDPSPLTAPTPTPESTPEQVSNSAISKQAEQPGSPKSVNQRLADATKGVEGMKNVAGIVENTASAPNNLQSVSDAIDTFSPILEPLKAFNSIAERLADIHPYAKVALSIFTCASKMILDQASRDAAVSSLLAKISAVYALLTKEEALARISSVVEIYGKIARQTLECADFIVHYSDMKGFWRRLGKHVFKETEAAIQSYNGVLDNLMQQFRDQVSIDTILTVHRIGKSWL